MRVMVIVKASKNSEAGIMPSEKLLADMGKYNEELVKAGIMLGGDGLQPSSKSETHPDGRQQAHGRRRTIRRDKRAGRRLLDLAGAIDR